MKANTYLFLLFFACQVNQTIASDTICIKYNFHKSVFEFDTLCCSYLDKDLNYYSELSDTLHWINKYIDYGITGKAYIRIKNDSIELLRAFGNDYSNDFNIDFINYYKSQQTKYEDVFLRISIPSERPIIVKTELSDDLKNMKLNTNAYYLFIINKYVNEADLFFKKSYKISNDSNVYIRKAAFIHSIPKKINSRNIVIINEDNKNVIYSNNLNSIYIANIQSAVFKGELMCIRVYLNVGDFVEGTEYFSSCIQDYCFFFRFNCKKKEYIFDKMETHGQ